MPGKKTKKGKGKDRLDKYYHLAKEQGFRSRAAFKLIQLNKKYDFLSTSKAILDLCAAPGGWLQVASKYMPVSGVLIGVDLAPIKPIKNAITFQSDITTQKCRNEIKSTLGNNKCDVVLNDGAPNVGMSWVQDAYSQAELVLMALKLAVDFLRPGGWFVTKIFRSKDYNNLMWVFNQLFKKVEATKPQASRAASAEIFVVCQGYLDPKKIDPKLLDPAYVFKEVETEAKKVDIFAKKQPRRSRQGYEDGVMLLFKKISVAEFIDTPTPVELLGMYNQLEFDDKAQQYKTHPATTKEILTLCEDLKVLGRADFKELLQWRLRMKQFKADEEGEEEEEEGEEEKAPTGEAKEEELTKELEEKLTLQQQRVKRLKKKKQKQLNKHRKKVELKMVLPDDEVEVQNDPHLFSVLNIKTNKQLAKVVSAEPDLVVEEGDENDIDFGGKKQKQDSDSDGDDDVDATEKYNREVEKLLDQMYKQYLERKTGRIIETTDEHDDIPIFSKRQKGEQTYVPRVSGDVFASDGDDSDAIADEDQGEDNPLVVRDDDVALSKKTSMWFSQGLFKDSALKLDNEEDEEDAIQKMKEKLAKSSKQKRKHKQEEDDEEEEDGYGVDGESKFATDKSVDVGNNNNNNKNKADKNKKANNNNNKKQADFEESDDSDDDSEDETKSKRKHKGDDDFEEVPMEAQEDNWTDEQKAKVMALGTMMVNSKQLKEDLIDKAYNRYAFNDAELPVWFEDEETEHLTPQMPITRELMNEMRLKFLAVNARPIKKIAEAQARKKLKVVRKLEQMKGKAESIVGNSEMSAGDKAKALEKLYKKSKARTKKEKVYVVAKKGAKGAIPSGMKQPGKRTVMVDPRLKKDLRGRTAKEKGAAKSAKSKKRKRN